MTHKAKSHVSGWIALTFFTTLFAMSSVIVAFLVRDFKHFDEYHQQISYFSTYSVSHELNQYFENQERLAKLVISAHQAAINTWIQEPDNSRKYQTVKDIITLFFPDHYSFTLADHTGHAIWDDLGENIGEKCLTELYEYTNHHSNKHQNKHLISSIHPGPARYHYDIFLPVHLLGETKVLLISFAQDKLVEMLANRQSVDHNLIIINQASANLIEITGYGGRDQISRPFNLSHHEEWLIYEGLGGKKEIENTPWAVVDMIDPEKREQKRQQMITGISLTVIATLLLALIGDFSLSRYRQITQEREKLLEETNQTLEAEVSKRTEQLVAQKAQLKLAANVFAQSREGILISDAHNRIVEVNQALIHITGFSREELIGKNPRVLNAGHHAPEFYKNMWQSLQEFDCWHGELEDFNSRKHHHLIMQCAISVVRDEQNAICNYIAIYTNITPLKNAQKALEHMAYYDRLTELPNRTMLFDRLEQSFACNYRNHTLLAVCYMDLDGFKPVNDTLGHEAGDELLKAVATRLRNILRAEDTAARLGGDEFVLLINNLEHKEACQLALSRVMQQMQSPFVIQGKTVHIGASIGVSFYPEHGTNADQLLRTADQAMYAIKRTGKNNIFYADSSLHIS